MIGDLRNEMIAWSNHTIFYKMIFELQIYQKVELDPRFIERINKVKLSD